MKAPSDVFTPRATDINSDMYISRENLEISLSSKIQTEHKHLIIHGDSGCGKTWTYKRVLGQLNATYVVINLANASRLKSIQTAIQQSLQGGNFVKTTYTETKSATGGIPLVASGHLSHTATYQKFSDDPLIDALENIRNNAGDGLGVIVLDNLERIFDSADLMRELADIITLIDDNNYSTYQVKIIIVGTPHDVRRYFSKTPTTATVSNRLSSLEEVYRLNQEQTKDFFFRGLVEQLNLISESNPNLDLIINHATWVTEGIPQRMHEYGLILSNERLRNPEKSWEESLKTADKEWIAEHLEKCYSIIEDSMNKNSTKIQRRNQVIYSAGNMSSRDFKTRDIDDFLRKNFPSSTCEVVLNTPQTLSELEGSLLRRTPKGDAFTFLDPAFKLCIRAMLIKQGETINKIEISDAIGSLSN